MRSRSDEFRVRAARLAAVLAAALAWPGAASPCTNILVTKGATADGSTMISYSADSHELYGELLVTPGGQFPPGSMREVFDWDSGEFLGRIAQAPRTYWVVGLMNEHQLAIGETTFGGRKELEGPAGILDYGSLMTIALERTATARDAIVTMGQLLEEYGYASTGESFSISDPNEVWLMELIGKGKDQKGAVWVAVRLPEGALSAHANQARIRSFPLHDPENCLYSKDVISLARERGWYTGRDEDFSFADTYAPLDFDALRACEARVWNVFRRAAPSLALSPDSVDGSTALRRLPLYVKPDRKLAVQDVMALMRDHFEGTPFDMTKDVGAGPYACPYRWRPMRFEVDGQQYLHERAISTQQTGFSFVTQSRAWLPDAIGGVSWWGFDDTYQTVYTPMYCGIREAPRSFGKGAGDFSRFSWESAFWVFNFVSNYTYSRYSEMIVDVQAVQRELEGRFLTDQAEVERAARSLHDRAPALARDYLTDYCVRMGDLVTARWKALGEHLIWKYLDGNLRDAQGKVLHPEYPKQWYRRIVEDAGDRLKVVTPEGAPSPAPSPAP